jgi:hypothetical protein
MQAVAVRTFYSPLSRRQSRDHPARRLAPAAASTGTAPCISVVRRSKSRKDPPNPAASPAMEFRFRSGDGEPRRRFSGLPRPRDRRFTPRGKHRQTELHSLQRTPLTDSLRSGAAVPGHFHGGPPLPPPPQVEWEAAARREQIISKEVERRLIEEEVCRELALARARLHGGFGPEPFFRPDSPFVPPPPGPLFGPDAHFMPPPMAAGMHSNGLLPASSEPWQGTGPLRRSGFGQWKFLGEARRPLPPPKPKHKLEPLKVQSSERSEVCTRFCCYFDCL